jgi:hypothetical protein
MMANGLAGKSSRRQHEAAAVAFTLLRPTRLEWQAK